jgi:hypothetical protein
MAQRWTDSIFIHPRLVNLTREGNVFPHFDNVSF